MKMRWGAWLGLCGWLLLVTACGAGAAAPEPPPATETPAPPAATATPTETVVPTATSVPTDTPLPTATPEPTATPAPPAFTFDSEEPLFERAETGVEGLTYINPGALFFHDGQFHMFANVFSLWPGTVEIAYMTSPDGATWQADPASPVFNTDLIPFAAPGADVGGGYVADDGSWVLIFHTVNVSRPSVIGRATAPGPAGPWQIDAKPILEPGGRDAWDEAGLTWPSVARGPDGYVMTYTGQSRVGSRMAIGMATSPDGLVWTRYDDPATTEEALAGSDPVLVPEQEWERDQVDRARIVYADDHWQMIYAGRSRDSRGLAWSEDAVEWSRHPANPIITSRNYPVPAGTSWDTALVVQDGVAYYIMEIGSLRGTNLYLLTHQGPLVPFP